MSDEAEAERLEKAKEIQRLADLGEFDWENTILGDAIDFLWLGSQGRSMNVQEGRRSHRKFHISNQAS